MFCIHVFVLELVLVLGVEDDAIVVNEGPHGHRPLRPLEEPRHRVEEPRHFLELCHDVFRRTTAAAIVCSSAARNRGCWEDVHT